MLGSCVLLYSCLSLRFSLVRSRIARLIGDLESLRLYTLGVDVSTAFMSLSHKVTASSSSSSCVVMFVSVLVRLSFIELCSKSSFFICFVKSVMWFGKWCVPFEWLVK